MTKDLQPSDRSVSLCHL